MKTIEERAEAYIEDKDCLGLGLGLYSFKNKKEYMKKLIIIGLIVGLIGCDFSAGNESSNDDNSVINQDVRCQECGKKETLIEFGYEDINCSARCPQSNTGEGIDEDCDRACIEEERLLYEMALNSCRANYNCGDEL